MAELLSARVDTFTFIIKGVDGEGNVYASLTMPSWQSVVKYDLEGSDIVRGE
jgi:hypothetical protein